MLGSHEVLKHNLITLLKSWVVLLKVNLICKILLATLTLVVKQPAIQPFVKVTRFKLLIA